MDADMTAVRAELGARITALDRTPKRWRGARELAGQVDAIRSIADRAGLKPAAAVAGLLDAALARGEYRGLAGDWLALLREAVACERTDVRAAQAFAAACQVRIAG